MIIDRFSVVAFIGSTIHVISVVIIHVFVICFVGYLRYFTCAKEISNLLSFAICSVSQQGSANKFP